MIANGQHQGQVVACEGRNSKGKITFGMPYVLYKIQLPDGYVYVANGFDPISDFYRRALDLAEDDSFEELGRQIGRDLTVKVRDNIATFVVEPR